MKITVLPIKRFALILSDVFIDVIQKIWYKKEEGWRRGGFVFNDKVYRVEV
jgi:hypothetical protein